MKLYKNLKKIIPKVLHYPLRKYNDRQIKQPIHQRKVGMLLTSKMKCIMKYNISHLPYLQIF